MILKSLGEYTVIYEAVNKIGRNPVQIKRKVIVEDRNAPIITLKGDTIVTIMQDEIYTDLGIIAVDDVDGDISSKVNIKNEINNQIVGVYKVMYTVFDSSGNEGVVERTVNVVAKPIVDNNKTIYLTFDDGPSSVTEPLLNMLKKYNVKATFFVVGVQLDKYRNVIKKASDEGHVIAVHCNMHDYKYVYDSDSEFFNQLEITRNKVKDITGKDTTIFRFPGGSSNTVSRKINPGVMTRITKEALNRGYRYYDWNMDSRDATGKLSSNQIFDNLKNGLNVKSNTIISLSHDANSKNTTIYGTEMFINYCQRLGFKFDVITDKTPMVTQKIAN